MHFSLSGRSNRRTTQPQMDGNSLLINFSYFPISPLSSPLVSRNKQLTLIHFLKSHCGIWGGIVGVAGWEITAFQTRHTGHTWHRRSRGRITWVGELHTYTRAQHRPDLWLSGSNMGCLEDGHWILLHLSLWFGTPARGGKSIVRHQAL